LIPGWATGATDGPFLFMKKRQDKLSKPQTRALVALDILERIRNYPWWPLHAIGEVVYGCGYRPVATATIHKLKIAGLVQTERSTWPDSVTAYVRCNCSSHNWGLTDAGREYLNGLTIKISEETRGFAEKVLAEHNLPIRDGDWRYGEDENE